MNGIRQTVQNFLGCATKLKVKHMSNNPRNVVYTNTNFIINIIMTYDVTTAEMVFLFIVDCKTLYIVFI